MPGPWPRSFRWCRRAGAAEFNAGLHATAAARDIVSQTSIADSTARELAASAAGALPRRVLRAAACGSICWLIQAVPAACDPGLGLLGYGLIRPGLVLASYAAALLASMVLGLRRDDIVRTRPAKASWVGVAFALDHLILLAALPGGVGLHEGAWTAIAWPDLAWIWIVLSVAVATATLAALAWGTALGVDRWGRICMIAVSVTGLALMHLTGRAALYGGVPIVLAAAAVPWCGSLGLLLGIRLGDLSLIASRRSVAIRERFRVIAEALPIPIVLTGPDNRRVLFANHRSQAQFYPPGGADRTDAYYVVPEDQQKLLDRLRRAGSVENYEVEMRRGDGSTFWALVSATSITFSGEPAILASYHDITDRKAAEEALLASEVRYALISRAANDGIWDWDIPTGAVYYSSRWKEIVGIAPGQRLTMLEDWLGRVHAEDVGRLRRDIDAHIAGTTPQLDCEYRILHGDGRYCWMQCRAIALRNNQGEPIRMAGSQSDITLRKTYEINLLNAAYEDRLTGINNRAFFSQLVESRNSVQSIEGTAILLLNVDQFRRLNDSLGSGAGDALLIAMARRLAGRIKPVDALSRIGNDEFTIWLQSVDGHEATYTLAETLLADLSLPYALGDAEMSVGVSIGIATPTLGDAENGADLLRNARLALDRAKLLGGARVELFDDALLHETHLKRRLSKDLTAAERLGQIFFEYQPVVSLDAGGVNTIIGFEMLMRWQHPDLGLIPPARFIPIAEEAGLIGQLGLFAIECAAREIAGWTDAGLVPEEFSIAVNLSNRQISDRAGTLRLHALLDRLAVPRGRLKLEITESVLMSDPEAMATALHEFKQRGIDLSLDDFGTGYSSLSYLHRFPLDVLKIDRSFVSRMLRSPEALRLVRSIIELSHDLGLEVVAEGVEAIEESDLLRQLGCDNAQGYYYSRPVSSERARALLERRII
jgi:diguanylate cyclase (GGDEF)-like protein/PAS domain S-box-containing protein